MYDTSVDPWNNEGPISHMGVFVVRPRPPSPLSVLAYIHRMCQDGYVKKKTVKANDVCKLKIFNIAMKFLTPQSASVTMSRGFTDSL